jgi:hypothetical protein
VPFGERWMRLQIRFADRVLVPKAGKVSDRQHGARSISKVIMVESTALAARNWQ